ncbi:probable protein adenylyltransferase fic-1 [Coccomyxa sp. Obi]|nr:probable protein adenylyltransferase fic-1 [Coccomyxa sp. Obi]
MADPSWLPWWQTLGLTPNRLKDEINEKSSLLDTSDVSKEYMKTFSKHMAVLCVYISNRHEGTLPEGFQQYETFGFLQKLLEGQAVASEGVNTAASWNSDGKSKDPATARRQLLQHLQALQYLCYECEPGSKPLTVQMLQHTHRLMMQGAVAEDGQPLEAGHFRINTASAGTGQVYLDPGLIADRTAKYVAIYNAAVEVNVDVSKRAADLFYGLIHLVHPFKDGNGRLGQLLVAYALMAGGVPFPLPLEDGHHKSRNHYQHVVLHYAKISHNTRLQHFILECLHHKWVNFAQQVEVRAVCRCILVIGSPCQRQVLALFGPAPGVRLFLQPVHVSVRQQPVLPAATAYVAIPGVGHKLISTPAQQ